MQGYYEDSRHRRCRIYWNHVAEALLKRGDEVIGLDNFAPNYSRARKEATSKSMRATSASRSSKPHPRRAGHARLFKRRSLIG
jgi:nucleoside-diphosphate-sugar epimerase